jgi:cytoskeleton protein RodZ
MSEIEARIDAVSEETATSSANPGASVSPHVSIGQSLRVAREAMNLSTDDVAEVLRFSVKQIEAIEAGQFEALPGATLIRGFIRGYAKFLRLDPQELLAKLDSTLPSKAPDIRPPSEIASAVEVPLLAALTTGKVMFGLFFVMAFVLSLYAFVSADEEQSAAQSSHMSQASPVQGAPVEAAMPNAPEQASATDTATLPVADVAGGGAETSMQTGNADTQAVSAKTSTRVLLDFDELSWIEIVDASKNKILVGEFPKGAHRVVEGTPPYAVWVGRASAVRMTYRGEAVDLVSKSREDIARLTLE